MPTIPTYDNPQVATRALGAQQTRTLAPVDNTGALVDAATRMSGQVMGAMQREREAADTAALMEAEAALSQSKLDMMFDPSAGAYSQKGKNALNVTNTYLPKFDETAKEIGGRLTNEQQRARFSQIVSSQRQQLNGELNRYEYGERQSYYDETDKANLATSIEGATKYAADPQMVAYYQSKGNAVLGSMGRRKGMPVEQQELQRLEFNSKLSTSVITTMAASDPLKAQQYYVTVAPGMTAADSAAVNKILGTSVRKQMAAGMAESAWAGGGMGDAGLVPLIIQAESGGNPEAVSPKGARGLMQLMPDTAKEVSKELGIPYDEERLTKDPQYNMALGTAYINKMLGRYNGNQALALAAYNGGMGNVDEWIKKYGDPRKGEITTEEWVAKIPFKETREYTSKIMGQAAPGAEATTTSQKYAAALKKASEIQDPDLAKLYRDNIETYKKADEAQLAATYDQAAEYVNTGGYQSIPDALLAQLPAEEQLKLREFDTKLRAGTQPVTDDAKFEEFLSMPTAQLAELSLAKDVRPYLNNAAYKKVTTAWQAARKGDEQTQKSAAAENKAVKSVMGLAGIVVGDSQAAQTDKNIKARQQFEFAFSQLRAAFVQKNKADPTPDEAQKMAEQLLVDVRMGGNSWFGDDKLQAWQVRAGESDKVYVDPDDIDIESLPPNERKAAVDRLRSMGVTAINESTITEAYLQILNARGLKVKR